VLAAFALSEMAPAASGVMIQGEIVVGEFLREMAEGAFPMLEYARGPVVHKQNPKM